ncbi:MAG: methylmalonyl-CoA carboxyltransferase [Desulforhopalus sp.]|nr:methylmalonyl-CoA carboxyltransferase [Desulforhopalus sp.]
MSEDKRQQLLEKRQKIELGGGLKRIETQHAKGKLTARERLYLLFDEGTFVEMDAFVRARHSDGRKYQAESVVTGYGQIYGRIVYAHSQDFTITGGSLGEMHSAKICSAMDAAAKIGAPIVGLNDSGGARIQEAVDALNGYGNIFYKHASYSGVIPQITAILGPCAGGAVYSPALTDFIFMVDGTSQMFITGPQVIKTVTGEEISAEDLGGAMLHNSISGNAHFYMPSEQECINSIRELLQYLPPNNLARAPRFEVSGDINARVEALNDIVPVNPNKAYDMMEIIYQLVDDQTFIPYMDFYACNILTGFCRINGASVGIVANQPNVMAGCLDMNASDKAARFIRTCDAFNIPLLTLVDVPGFLPGTSQEHNGIIRHGAKMLYAFSEATVPKVSIIVRKAYGGAYIAMCSKSLGADLVFAWPSAEVAVMGPEGAVNIVYKHEIAEAEDKEAVRAKLLSEYRLKFGSPYQAAERGYIDDVIEPAITRLRIIDAFNMLEGKSQQHPRKKHCNLPL